MEMVILYRPNHGKSYRPFTFLQYLDHTLMSRGNLKTVSVRAASSMSYGRPSKMSSSLSSHLSRTAELMWTALGPSTSSSVLLHQTAEENRFSFFAENFNV